MFLPKSLVCLREGYTKHIVMQDLLAGITVGIIAIPLAMAFAIASGVAPERGLYTAIIAGFLVSLLGGSRVQVAGPTGAFVVILYSIVARHGYEGLAIATIMAGMILIAMGLLRLGGAIRFIPYPVVTGFTAGIALIIFSSQIKDFFGLDTGALPADFLGKWSVYLSHLSSWNPSATLIALFTLAGILLLRRFSPNIPAAALMLVVATAATAIFHLPVETIGSLFGGIPDRLPSPAIPDGITLERIRLLLPDSITIALLCAIESLLCAVVADGMTGYNHKSNIELVAQGIANIASVLFGGIAATGAIARTAANIKSGGRTPLSGMVHAATILLCMWLFSNLASQVPLAALAAILVVVAWNMSEIQHFIHLFRAPRHDVAVLLLTFGLTVFVDLTTGVIAGMLIATLLFMKHMSDLTRVDGVAEEDRVEDAAIPEGVQLFELSGPLFFGATDRLKTALRRVKARPRVLVLRMRQVPIIDASGLYALEMFALECRKIGAALLLSELSDPVERAVLRAGHGHPLGDVPIFDRVETALLEASRRIA